MFIGKVRMCLPFSVNKFLYLLTQADDANRLGKKIYQHPTKLERFYGNSLTNYTSFPFTIVLWMVLQASYYNRLTDIYKTILKLN